MAQPILEINLKKISYDLDKVILKAIDLKIDSNGLYGVFGRNGQGKSTFLKTLCGLKSYEGTIRLNNEILQPSDVAFLATEPMIYEYLTAEEFYKFYQKVSGRKNSSSTRIFDINEKVLLKTMSTGTLKKAYVNTILQFDDYKIYIFDEPFNGLDIESNYVLLHKIRELAKENIVFVSSHIIEIVSPYLTKTFYVNEQQITEVENENIMDLFMQSIDHG
ncbi:MULTISPECIES: ATP-binding cassette domain-containing protein [unclassified Empedobacter]|uniref:ATP-binding cassette domain-containing protein n=1 Tax=unclassified Empedobacter TaxID=2643773 RepID=UPI0025BDB240|nr:MULTISPECIES: ATP-binding cassette domain-containing protein [unclassified Empedobacter]